MTSRTIPTIIEFFKKRKRDSALLLFLNKKLPIFWIVGPSGSGKSTLAEMLSKCSKYHLINITTLIKDEASRNNLNNLIKNSNKNTSNRIIVKLLKKEFIRTYQNAIGYIIDGFPTSIYTAALFEKEICKVNIIVCLRLVLDAVLCRRVTQFGYFDTDEERIKYVISLKKANKLINKYKCKTILITSNYPPEDTCTTLVETLEDFWGYKFLRLYNKHA